MRRKQAVFIFGVVASIGLLASAAFACTTWRNKMTVTGSGSSPGSVTAQGWDDDMRYCSSGQPSGTAGMDDNTNGTVTVTIEPSTGSCESPDLPDATYDIRWTTGTWSPSSPGTNDCMSTTDVGDISISSGNGGPTSSNSFNPGGAGTIQVCVTNSNQTFGMQVPLTVA